jgi:hypothetical protein
MKSVLIVCFTDLRSDARVTRQINFLKNKFEITVACLDAYPDDTIEIIKVKKKNLTLSRKLLLSVLLLSRLDSKAYDILYGYRDHIPDLRTRNFDLIIANDIEALPFAFDVASAHTKIFFDAHEYAPRQFEDRLYWRVFFRRFITKLCRTYVPRVHGMSTINGGIAEAFEKNFNMRPVVVTNASAYYEMSPIVRDRPPIRLVHHGIFTLSRQPDIMLDMMALLDDRFTLDLIYLLPGHASSQTKEYFRKFKIRAEQTGKIKVLPALKSWEIVATLNQNYDMGLILVPPVNFNYENGLPNKLFECIQARIAMAVGPLREIANIVKRYEIGIVSPDFTAQGMASAINKMSLAELNQFKKRTEVAAREMNSEFNKEVFLRELDRIV